MMKLLVASLAILTLAKASDHKSMTYYPDGMEDPNVKEKMYWTDGLGIVEDISKFDALYVTHHGCV
jgi:hypothetical protein